MPSLRRPAAFPTGTGHRPVAGPFGNVRTVEEPPRLASIHIYPLKAGRPSISASPPWNRGVWPVTAGGSWSTAPAGSSASVRNRRWPGSPRRTRAAGADQLAGGPPLPTDAITLSAAGHLPLKVTMPWAADDTEMVPVAVWESTGPRRGGGQGGRRLARPSAGPRCPSRLPGRSDAPGGRSGLRGPRRPGELRRWLPAAAHQRRLAGGARRLARRRRPSTGPDEPVPAECGGRGRPRVGRGRLAPDQDRHRHLPGGQAVRALRGHHDRSDDRGSAAGSPWNCSADAAGSASSWSSGRT